MPNAQEIIKNWPEQSEEAAKLVIEKYGSPDEATNSMLIWHDLGPWKRIVAYRDYDEHYFPAPHIDAVESFISYNVPSDKFSDLAAFDGSVVANRTRGELSARCHDEQANFLALNLAHDVIEGDRTVNEAREYYAKEFLDYRRGEPTPYMEGLHFSASGGPDFDERIITENELKEAQSVRSA